MRPILLFRLLLGISFATLTLQAGAQSGPTWQQVLQVGGLRTDRVLATVADAQGNVYQTGYFVGTVQCGALALTMATTATYDMYLIKSDAQGNVLWARQAGSSTNSNTVAARPAYGTARGNQLALDTAGNVYVTGFFRGKVSFDGATTLDAPDNSPAAFVVTYSPQGTVRWAQKAQATQEVDASGLALTPSGEVYIAGYFKGNLSLGPRTLTSLSGTNDAFLAKYSTAGTPQWIRQIGGRADDYGYSLQPGPSNSVYLAGSFTTSISTGSLTAAGYGKMDIFLTRYDSSGNAQWLQSFGGPGDDYAGALAVVPAGDVYCTGAFSLTTRFGGQTLTSAGGTDGFLLKCSAQGVPNWVQQMGGSGDDALYSVLIPAAGPIYVSGSFEATSTIASQTLVSAGGSDIFVARYTSLGNAVWAVRGGGGQNESVSNLCYSTRTGLQLGVQFSGMTQFDALTVTSRGDLDVLLCQLQDNVPW